MSETQWVGVEPAMPLDQPRGLQTDCVMVSVPTWRDHKRYLWPLGLIVPGLVGASWLAVWATGHGVFWWAGPILSPSGSCRCLTISSVPTPIILPTAPSRGWRPIRSTGGSRIFTCPVSTSPRRTRVLAVGRRWLAHDGFLDKLGLMVTVGVIGGIAINVAHVLGHTRGRRRIG